MLRQPTHKQFRKALRRKVLKSLLHVGLWTGALTYGTTAYAQQPGSPRLGVATAGQGSQAAMQQGVAMQIAAAGNQTTLQTYDVPSQLVGTVGAQLQLLYHRVPGVTITTDPQTQQLMVMAPSNVQQQVAESIRRLMQQGGIPEGDQGIAAKSHDEKLYTFRNLTWRELEGALTRLVGARMELTVENNGEIAQLKIPNAHGLNDLLRVDRRNNQVNILGTGPTVAAWTQVIHSLDVGQADPDQATHVVPLSPAQPRSVRRMIQLVSTTRQQTTEEQEDQENPNAPATAVLDQQGLAADSGLLGDVQIEVVDSVGLIIVKGSKRDVQRTLQVIEQIKKQASLTEPSVEILQLQHSNSEAVATLITQLYESVYQPRQGSVSITALVQPNALLLIGRPEVVQSVKDLVAKIDTPLEPTDQLKVVRLKHASAVDLETRIRDFFTGTASTAAGAPAAGGATGTTSTNLATRVRISSDYRTNSLVIKASPREVAEVEKLILDLDVESSETENRVQVFPLKYSIAQELQQVITQILTGQATGNQQGGLGQNQQGQQGAAAGRATTPSGKLSLLTVDGQKVESGVLAGVIISADPSVNSLVVRAPAPSMPLIGQLIKELDVLPSAEARMKIFQLKNSDATTVALTLQNLYGLSPSAGQGAQFALQNNFLNSIRTGLNTGGESSLIQLRITPEARSNSVIISGAESDLEVIEALILRLDEDLAASRRSEVIWLRHANAPEVATALQTYFQQIITSQNTLVTQGVISIQELVNRQLFAVADQATNSILLSASNEYFETAMRLIERLDRRPPMVSVQVLVAEIQLNDSVEMGAEFGIQDSLLYSRRSTTGGTLASPVFNTLTTISSPTAAQNLAGQGLTALGVGRSNANGLGGAVLSASSESVGILIRALQTAGRLQILNRPQLTTLDSRPANAVVGGAVPRISGVIPGNGLNPQQIIVNDVQVGLILSVTPRVSPDGLILMQVGVENSSVGDPATGIPVGFGPNGETIRSPIINQTRADTVVSAYSGQTVVFAGLISKNRNTSRSQVPFLGSLPLIGAAFRFDVEAETRRELLVVMTPRIIQTEDDYETLKQVESSRMSWCLADVLNIHGDQGLSGGNGLWGPARSAVLFPDMPRERIPDRAEHNLDNNYPIPGSYQGSGYDMIQPAPEPAIPYDVEASKQPAPQFQQASFRSGDVTLQNLNNQSIPTVPTMPTAPTKTPATVGVQQGLYE